MLPTTPVRVPRRTLLNAAGLAACGSLLRPDAVRAETAAPFTLGIQLFSLRGYPVAEALKHAKDLGFEAVEFFSKMMPISSSPEEIAALRQQVADLGLRISGHGVNAFNGNAAASRKVFEFAQAAGIRTLICDPKPDAFPSLDELVKEFDIRLAIHNHGPRHRYNKVVDVPAVFAALRRVRFPADGALSLEYEENPENPLAEIEQCVAVARAAMAAG